MNSSLATPQPVASARESHVALTTSSKKIVCCSVVEELMTQPSLDTFITNHRSIDPKNLQQPLYEDYDDTSPEIQRSLLNYRIILRSYMRVMPFILAPTNQIIISIDVTK